MQKVSDAMKENKKDEIMERSKHFYRERDQLVKLIEECGEAITAISKLMLNVGSWDNAMEEIADVSVMVQQIKQYGPNQDVIEDIEYRKLLRLEERMNSVQS